MSQEYDLTSLEAQSAKLTSPELLWVEALRARWDDPAGRAITSREWQRVRDLTAEAAGRS